MSGAVAWLGDDERFQDHACKLSPGFSFSQVIGQKECLPVSSAARVVPKEMSGVSKRNEAASPVFLDCFIYFKFKIPSYTFTKTFGQKFDIFSFSSLRFIISINHYLLFKSSCLGILSESALPSIIYFL